MSQGNAKLIFFCQLCNAPIDSNICKIHGIDFVTIKKVYVDQPNIATQTKKNPPQAQARPKATPAPQNGTLRLENQKPGAATGNRPPTGDTRIARASDNPPESSETGLARIGADGQPIQEQYLPAVPGQENQTQETLPARPEDLARQEAEAAAAANAARQQAPQPAPGAFEEDFLDPQNFQQADTQFKQMDPEVPEYFEQITPEFAEQTVAKPSSGKGILIGISLLLVVLSAAAAYFLFFQEKGSASQLYSEAEAVYSQQNYTQALALYNRFIDEYPNDPLRPVVMAKIEELRQQGTVDTVNMPSNNIHADKINELMLKANIAFKNGNYDKPNGDNVIAHIRSVLNLDDSYKPALDMQQKIVDFYNNKATEALNRGESTAAIGYYRTIHQIRPEDTEVLLKIRSILTQKSGQSRN